MKIEEFPIRVDYDHDLLDILDSLNAELLKRNLLIDVEQKEHDGYVLMRIIELSKKTRRAE